MENRHILNAYLVAWMVYIVGVHVFARRMRVSQFVVLLSHFAASAVAISMAYVFVIEDGVTVAQYAAGDAQLSSMWSLWAWLWLPLLGVCAFAGLLQLFWVAGVAEAKRARWAVVACLALGMSMFAFATVLANFPDA